MLERNKNFYKKISQIKDISLALELFRLSL